MPVRVVTDSTADLSPETVEELAITVVPQLVIFGNEELRDGVDLTTEQFFQRMVTSSVHPGTSQASVGAFQAAYESLVDEADAIVSVYVGGCFSGTVSSATLARDSIDTSCRIEIVDSRTASLGLGFAVIAAARAAKAGASVEEVVAAAQSVISRVHAICFLDTLEYARRGGRVSRIESFLGNLLSIKPILSIYDDVKPLSRARTRTAALQKMFELAMAHPNIVDVGILWATTPEDADLLAEMTRERLPGVPIRIARMGPALGAHGGPGIMAMAVVEGENLNG